MTADQNQMDDALKMQSIINKLKDDRPKGKTELKIIIDVLQSISLKKQAVSLKDFFALGRTHVMISLIFQKESY